MMHMCPPGYLGCERVAGWPQRVRTRELAERLPLHAAAEGPFKFGDAAEGAEGCKVLLAAEGGEHSGKVSD